MKKHIYYLALSLFLFACSPIPKILNNGTVKESSFTEKIPFNFDYGVPIIKVTINGKNYNFLFDTGAPTVISPELATQLNLKVAAKSKTSDSQGHSNPQEFVVVPHIKVGNLNFEHIGAVIIDMKKVFEFKCMNFDGIIGANQMAKAVWQIDYRNKMLTASNEINNFNIPTDAQIINFTPRHPQKTPLILVKIGTKTVYATFDTGATTDFNLPYDIFENEMLSFKGAESNGNSSSGIYGSSKSSTTTYKKIPSLAVDSLKLTNQIITFSEDASSLIGNTFFKNYRLILNWKENKIYLIKEIDYKNDKYETFGIGLKYINNKPTIVKIFKDTPAEKSGLLINDQIIELDGKDTSNLTATEACYFSFHNMLSGKETRLITVLRNGEKLTYSLKKQVILE